MQKSTILIIILALVSVSIIGKLFAYDYLREGWANIFYGESEEEQITQEQALIPEQIVVQPEIPQSPEDVNKQAETPSEQTPAETAVQTSKEEKTTEIQKLIAEIKLEFEKITPEQLDEAGFKNAKSAAAVFDNRIFQIIDVSDVTNSQTGQFDIADEKNIYAVITEMRFQTQLEAQDVYSLAKKRIQGMPGISINETDQFGDASFFMNDSKRIGNAFLTARIKNHLYFFVYPKTNNEFIKNLIVILNK